MTQYCTLSCGEVRPQVTERCSEQFIISASRAIILHIGAQWWFEFKLAVAPLNLEYLEAIGRT